MHLLLHEINKADSESESSNKNLLVASTSKEIESVVFEEKVETSPIKYFKEIVSETDIASLEEAIETNAVFEALENNSMILDDNFETKITSNEIEYIDDIRALSLKEMLKEMVELEDGVWKCKVCGKISKSLAHAKQKSMEKFTSKVWDILLNLGILTRIWFFIVRKRKSANIC